MCLQIISERLNLTTQVYSALKTLYPRNINLCFMYIFRIGDGAYVQAKGCQVIHECIVEDVRRESVILHISQRAKDDWYVSEETVCIIYLYDTVCT